MTRYASLLGTGGYLPETILTNEQISQTIETTNEWIVERTGIRERRIAAKHETASSMAEIAARQALEAAGLWTAIRPKLVIGENVGQAMQFAAGGDTQGGLVPLALVATPPMAAAGAHATIPESKHDPLRQRMTLLRPATPAAERLYAYLQGASARAILARHGYAVPGGPD